jgi:hypothetical protein
MTTPTRPSSGNGDANEIIVALTDVGATAVTTYPLTDGTWEARAVMPHARFRSKGTTRRDALAGLHKAVMTAYHEL